jgi:hypothetical protein
MRSISLLAVLALVSAAVATGGSRGFEMRIFDPARSAQPVITADEVIRSSARAVHDPTDIEHTALYFRLTPQGVVAFRALTRELARRGARANRPLAFAVEINGRIRARPTIDYHFFANGIDATQGIQVSGLTAAVARTLAKQIRGG